MDFNMQNKENHIFISNICAYGSTFKPELIDTSMDILNSTLAA